VGALAPDHVLLIMIMIMAVLALVVVQALAKVRGCVHDRDHDSCRDADGDRIATGRVSVGWVTVFGVARTRFRSLGRAIPGKTSDARTLVRQDANGRLAVMIYGLAASILPVGCS